MSRREFTPTQREAIVERSKQNGAICCEGCGIVLAGKTFEIDHIIPEGLRPAADKKNKLTIAEGQLLGRCCHRGPDGKTAKDIKQIAKGRRQFNKANGLTRAKSALSSPKPPKPPLTKVMPHRSLYQDRSS